MVSLWPSGARYHSTVRVLIVEDEPKSASYLRKGLSEHGYTTDLAENGEDGLYLAQNSEYDLLILDIMLPRRDGWSVITELRRFGKVPRELADKAEDAFIHSARSPEAIVLVVAGANNAGVSTVCPSLTTDLPLAGLHPIGNGTQEIVLKRERP